MEESAVTLDELWRRVTEGHPHIGWITRLLVHWISHVPFIGILMLLMLLDVLTGYIAAAVHKSIDSNISYRGALKKGQMVLMVAAGLVFELLYPDVPWGRLIAGLLCLSEMASIIENADKAGVPMPGQLREMMKRLRSAEKESQKTSPDTHVLVDVKTEDSSHYIAHIICDDTGAVLDWNPGAIRLLGWTKEEMIGKSITKFIPQRMRDNHIKAFKKAVHENRGPESDLSCRLRDSYAVRKDGSEIPVTITVNSWSNRNRRYFSAEILRRKTQENSEVNVSVDKNR